MNKIKEIYSFYMGSLDMSNNSSDDSNTKVFGSIFYISLFLICVYLILSNFVFKNDGIYTIKRIIICLFITIIVILLFIYIYFLVVGKKLYSYSYLDEDDNDDKKCDKIRFIEPPSINNSSILIIIFSIIYVILLTLYIISTNLSLNFINKITHIKPNPRDIIERIFDYDNVEYDINTDYIIKNPLKYKLISDIKHLSLFHIIFKWGINIIFMISYPIIYILHIIIVRVLLYFYGRYLYYYKLNDVDSRKKLALIFDKNVFFFNLSNRIKSGKTPYNKEEILNISNEKYLKEKTNIFSKLPYGIPWTSAISIIEKILLYMLVKTNKDVVKGVKPITDKISKKDILNFTNIDPNNKKLHNFGKDSHVFSFPMSLFVD